MGGVREEEIYLSLWIRIKVATNLTLRDEVHSEADGYHAKGLSGLVRLSQLRKVFVMLLYVPFIYWRTLRSLPIEYVVT